jgi:hypothetical protein
MGIETRYLQALEAETFKQAKNSVSTPKDDDRAYAYGISVGINRGLEIAISLIKSMTVSENEEDDN